MFEVLTDTTDIIHITARLLSVHARNPTYFPPLAKLAADEMVLVRITPTDAQWHDYAHS